MKKYVCDICKKDVGEHDLVTLHEHLQSVGIEHVCDGCKNEIEKVIVAIDRVVNPLKHHWVKQVINKLIINKGGG